MEDKPYQNREIDVMFEEIRQTLTRIEEQTRKTNGRVTELERYKYVQIGATAILTAVVVPILAWAMFTLVNINKTVHEAVDEALSAYNINGQSTSNH